MFIAWTTRFSAFRLCFKVNLVFKDMKSKQANIEVTSLKDLLNLACEGTGVSRRELFKALSRWEIKSVKEGDVTVDDLKQIVLEIEDSNQNAHLYRIDRSNTKPLDFIE